LNGCQSTDIFAKRLIALAFYSDILGTAPYLDKSTSRPRSQCRNKGYHARSREAQGSAPLQ